MLDYLIELPRPEPRLMHLPELIEDLRQTTDLQISWLGPDKLTID